MLKRFRLYVLTVALVAVFAFPVAAEAPRNIILFIGDGMGASQMTAAKIEAGTLNMERCKVGGLMMTDASDALVTDSAAAGTALATGVKTYNGAISVCPEKQPLKTVLEYAEDRGMRTGIVAACSVTHATPAVFMAHNESRANNNAIAADIATSGVDVLFGGGAAFFTPKSAEGGQRDDERNLLEEMSRDMRIVRSPAEFDAMPRAERVAGLFHPEHPPAAAERAPDLAALTEKAIEVLSQAPTGYFLMVEGSQIDWAGHGNDAGGIIAETLDFDDAVGVGLDAAQVDGDTLVVITSDHETGGFAIHNGDRHAKKVDETGFTSGGHTATMVPIFAYGPGAGAFGGVLDNTKVGRLLIDFVTRR